MDVESASYKEKEKETRLGEFLLLMVSKPTCADDAGDQRPCLKITPLGAGDASAQPLAGKESSKGVADLERNNVFAYQGCAVAMVLSLDVLELTERA
ncbi:hypothetical protein RHMOL_Rhmol05G0265700 [Rhododendron molle]|uniref:Uncharacterized protein n=1 Tax=Rhododendron molle TaxID=49168 RepID=A0ACC0NTJ4_RHOML|nr:hypothetical protein RHMOL_Rhmol05G0265700 [Rhododendron molle]